MATGAEVNDIEIKATKSALFNPYEHSAELGRFYYLTGKRIKMGCPLTPVAR